MHWEAQGVPALSSPDTRARVCVRVRVRAGGRGVAWRRSPCVCVRVRAPSACFRPRAHTQRGGTHASTPLTARVCVGGWARVCLGVGTRVRGVGHVCAWGVGTCVRGGVDTCMCVGGWARLCVRTWERRSAHRWAHACAGAPTRLRAPGGRWLRPTAPAPQSSHAPRWRRPSRGAEAGSQHRLQFPAPSLIPSTVSGSQHCLRFLAPSLVPGTVSGSRWRCRLPRTRQRPRARRLPGAGRPLPQRRRLGRAPSPLPELLRPARPCRRLPPERRAGWRGVGGRAHACAGSGGHAVGEPGDPGVIPPPRWRRLTWSLAAAAGSGTRSR